MSNERKPGVKGKEVKRAFVIKMEAAYRTFLERVLNRRYLVVFGFIAVFVFVMGVIAPRVPFTLFPQDDSDVLWIKVRMPEGTALEETEAAIAAIDEQIAPVVGDDLIATTARVGHLSVLALDRNTGGTDNIGYISAIMKPVDREKTCGEWAEVLTGTLVTPLGATITFEAKPIGPPVGFPVQIHVASNQDLDRRSTAQLVALRLGEVEGLTDINIDEKPGIRQIDLNPDYDKMAMYGISPKVVGQTLKAALFGVEVSELRTLDETMKFRVMFDQRTRTDLDGLLDAPILTQQRQTVSLRDVVRPVDVASSSTIYHQDGIRTATVTANFLPSAKWTSLSFAKYASKEVIPSFQQPNVSVFVGGEAVETEKATGDLAVVGFIAVLSICTVIAVMLNSFVEAIFVVCVIPFGIMGVFIAFWVHGASLSLFAMLGGIGLSGVVVNDSVVMVDGIHRILAKADDLSGSKRRALVIEAVSQRLRPILVTTTTTLGGVLPTAYGLGGHDMALSPMSLALGWGLFLATALTLILVPALYEIAQDIKGLRPKPATVLATALVIGFAPNALGAEQVVRRSEIGQLLKSRSHVSAMVKTQAQLEQQKAAEVGSILLPQVKLEGSVGWEKSSVLRGVDVEGNPLAGEFEPTFDVEETTVRADRIALVGQWNLSAEVLTKWLALRDLADAQAYDGEERERKLELGVKEMMTRHLMLEAMREVAQQNCSDTRQALKSLKSEPPQGPHLILTSYASKPPYSNRDLSLQPSLGTLVVLKAEVCAYLVLEDCESVSFENDEAFTSSRETPAFPELVVLTSKDRVSLAHQSRRNAAELQKVSEWLGWLPAVGVQGTVSKQKFSEESPFLPPEDGWTVGLGLSWELWDGGQRYQKLAQAESQASLAKLSIKQRGDELRAEVRRKRDTIDKTLVELELSEERRRLTQRGLELTQNAYDEGGASLDELLDIQAKALDAELGNLRARADYDLAWLAWQSLID